MQELAQNIKRKNVVLFVGAGVSMSLGLPSFGGLIAQLGKDLGYDPEIFRMYGNYSTLAEYYKLKKKGKLGRLRSSLDKQWHNPQIDIGKSEIHNAIVALDIPIIYTTNYDSWLERAYEHHNKRYNKIVNVSDLGDLDKTITQIVKLHGDFDDDSSLILTESEYYERLEFDHPLDIRFRADILGSIVLFIGYSLTDVNIRCLIYKLHKQWSLSGSAKFRQKSYLFLDKPNPVQKAVLENWGINILESSVDDPKQGLLDFLCKLKEAIDEA